MKDKFDLEKLKGLDIDLSQVDTKDLPLSVLLKLVPYVDKLGPYTNEISASDDLDWSRVSKRVLRKIPIVGALDADYDKMLRERYEQGNPVTLADLPRRYLKEFRDIDAYMDFLDLERERRKDSEFKELYF